MNQKLVKAIKPGLKPLTDVFAAEQKKQDLADLGQQASTAIQTATNTMKMDEETQPAEHKHIWKKGQLPGGVFVKSCECGKFEKISFDEWQTISGR